MNYYTSYVKKQKGWKLYKIFADEGISGTSRRKRIAFNQMIEDAMKGKIDYIITKSISRFARNTIDTLCCIRSLKSLTPPVGVYFEKENIDTLDSRSELILTILSALAQDESRSISDNVRWSIQKKFQSGIDVTNLSSMIGYEAGKNKEWIINEKQAEIVRYIYQRYLDGLSHEAIAKELMAHGWTTGRGNSVWRGEAVRRILKNEKYTGDSILQKTVTKDLFTHQSIPNNGMLPSYYIHNHHPAIIDRATWDAVQAEQKRRSQNMKKKGTSSQRYSGKWEFSSKLFCGNCSAPLIRRTFRLKTKSGTPKSCCSDRLLRYPVWRCRTADQSDPARFCGTQSYLEVSLKQSFMEYLYQLKHELLSCMNSPDSVSLLNQTPSSFSPLSSFRLVQEFTAILCQAKASPISDADHYAPSLLIQNFHWFLTELISLPDCAPDGSAFQIPGIASSYAIFDMLPFAGHIFQKVIAKGIVSEDQIIYETKFGISLLVEGNTRRFRDFYGFRKVEKDGTSKILNCPEDVSGEIVKTHC